MCFIWRICEIICNNCFLVIQDIWLNHKQAWCSQTEMYLLYIHLQPFNPQLYVFYFFWHVRCRRGRHTAASEAGGRCWLATYMYLSSDSLLTRMSLILSIFKSSPSMLSTVMVESAMDTTSSSEGQRELLERGWAIKSCFSSSTWLCHSILHANQMNSHLGARN